MSKHIEITQHLKSMEQGGFQIACMDYLKNTVGGIIFSPGTVDAKQKTKKGHPDIYLKQHDGRYVLAECTTKDDSNTTEFVKKLKSDLTECLKFEGLAIPKEKISMIYLCCNSTIDTATYENLEEIIASTKIKLVVVGLHELAIYFSSGGKSFAKDSLGIAFETGQILTKEQFLTQYGKKNISTPLDNPILGREDELTQLAEELSLHEIIILSGPGGVGKSRLAMEAIDLFVLSNPEYKPYYVFSKSGQITEDLATFLKPQNSYVLLIDDANRQLENLISILEKVIESEMRLKVILTVRDYAKQEVIRQCGNLRTGKFILRGLSDEIIAKIITKDPFGITNWQITNRIIQICKGNPRLAIMAANIMKSNPDLTLLSDVTTIYDEYFQTVLTDKEIFAKKLTKKVLGLIAYFYTIDTKEEYDCKIIESFGFQVDEFIAIGQQLEELEVVEIYDGSVLKISEQVLSTYFFYDAFLRNEVLSFESLLDKYFESHYYRVRDTFIAAINAFGQDNIIAKNQTIWINYWDRIKEIRATAFQFMIVFAPYFPNELFVLISECIKNLPEVEQDEILLDDIKNPPNNRERDEILNLLEGFYEYSGNDFMTAVHLGFEYAVKKKQISTILVEHLKTKLFISKSDIEDNFQRIDFVYKYLKENFSKSKLYRLAFYYIFDRVIISTAGRAELYDKVNEVYTLKSALKSLRTRFLEDIFNDFQNDEEISFSLLLDYVNDKNDLRYLEIEADTPLIFRIIDTHMRPENFGHYYFVQKYLRLVKLKANNFPSNLDEISLKFNSETYQLYALLSIKYDYSAQRDYEDFFLQKTKTITSALKVESLDFWGNMLSELKIISAFKKNSNNYNDGVAIVLRDILTRDKDLGFECLRIYLNQDNFLGLNGASVYAPVFSSNEEESKKLFKLITSLNFKYKSEWIQSFFYFLPEEYINKERICDLVDSYKDYDRYTDIHASNLKKFEEFSHRTVEKILTILVDRRLANNDFIYKLSHNFFHDSPELLEQDFSLCKKAYFQQEEMPGTYDQDSRELFVLLKKNNDFFDEYMDSLLDVEKRPYIGENKILSKVWELENCQEKVYNSLIKISEIRKTHRSEHLGCIFFYSLKEQYHEIAYQVFFKLVEDNPQNIDVLNTIIDTLRNSFRQFYFTIIKQIMSLNSDIEFFKRLEFHNNHFSTTSNEIWSEARAKELSNLLDAILTMPNHYKYFEHKKYLQDRIERENKATAEERKYMFRGFR